MILNVKVIPNAPRTEIRGMMADGTLRIALHAKRERGEANEVLCGFLAEHFGCGRDAVRIVRGKTSTRKIVEIQKARG